MVRHRNQASAPEICRPKISATAERLPSEPILPSPLKSKARRRPPRMVATMFPASTCAWRVACCAVGGDEPPSGVGIEAQSPSAQTPGNPGTSSSGVTWMRPPRALGSFTASITGWGNDGTVDTNVRVPMRMRSEEHTSELQSHVNIVCRLLLEKKKKKQITIRFRKNKTNNKIKIKSKTSK